MKPKKFKLDVIYNDSGELICDNSKNIPYECKRVFCVRSANGEKRGKHGHRTQSQTMVCLYGQIAIEYTFGDISERIILEPYEAFYAPPRTWAVQEYINSDNLLMVLCSGGYDPNDYIYDINELNS
jgi:hypothetical protein